MKPTASRGTLIRYDVRVEDGCPSIPIRLLCSSSKCSTISAVERHPSLGFELAPVGESARLHAYIVTPKTTDRLCAPYLTRGEVSCQNGTRVVLNAKRWLLGAESYRSDLTNYRRYLVNHEFGHALGKRHVDCPGQEAGTGHDAADQGTRGLPEEPMAASQRR